MNVDIVNHSKWPEPKDFILQWMTALTRELKPRGHDVAKQDIVVAFVEKAEIQRVNKEFRSRDKPTDILSFEDDGPNALGELALCGEVLEVQAKDHKLSVGQELGYLLIHGVLHLLGYEHEQGGEDEKKMFALQDEVFDILSRKFF